MKISSWTWAALGGLIASVDSGTSSTAAPSSSKDECTNDGGCGSAGATCAYCAYDPSLGHWACATTCAAG